VTPTPTVRPLTPLEKLTPASDGKYYHIIKSGETLSWIAKLYEVSLADLMAWNGLDDSSILYPNEKLLLLVTPPATKTPTSSPVTITPTATAWPSTPTLTSTTVPTQTVISPTSSVVSPITGGRTIVGWFILIGLALGGSLLFLFNSRKK
jgi:peptidoglycan endopeptidase LytE